MIDDFTPRELEVPRRPKLLDLFCSAGGTAMGYHRAGFDVTGVDIRHQPRFPFHFIRADALQFLRDHGHEYDAIAASPPCQRFSRAQRLQGRDHPDLLTPTLEILRASSRYWVVENVPGAPMPGAVTVCGLALGVAVKRHRLFLSSVPLVGTVCPIGHPGEWFTVYGGGAAKGKHDGRRRATAPEAKEAMRIGWMTRDELSQAIPPDYTKFIGLQLREFMVKARS